MSAAKETPTHYLSTFARLEQKLGRDGDAWFHCVRKEAIVALNTAFLQDGAFIEVPPGVTLNTPIYLLFVSTANEPIASHPRSLIIAGDNSRATIVEDYLAVGDGVYFTNAVTEIVAG